MRIDGRCVVATPYHAAANRAHELARGAGRHGSCGLGIGEAVVDARRFGPDETLFARDLVDPATTRAKLARIRERKQAEIGDSLGNIASLSLPDFDRNLLCDSQSPEHLSMFIEEVRSRVSVVDESAIFARLSKKGTIVFEGAHGVLLDEEVGFHPYSTWARTTDHHAQALLSAAGFDGQVTTLGLVRAYATRHGPGPLPTEDAALAGALPEAHNPEGPWQGAFRVGWYDAVMTRYALAACAQVDALAVSCLDRVADRPTVKVATRYEVDGAFVEALPASVTTEVVMRARPLLEDVATEGLAERIATLASRPLALSSQGPTWRDKTLHGTWSDGR
jgi:adenylosuccinate synthase